ncbi:PD-(D/E)XK nuclease family protein [Lacinutrix sp. C3R15]|uniref:PD-(D/E)XK nuclease family protein n=1 Tax=Flavobacteriaceae TaxID=49546 RepID=UPI001C0857B0|nr:MULTISPECIES: PD-(D/E)XK nuclease family protein [Flavobacteriaceae]MBU2940882.1 PD-(D/E)XK nuclease family protein [Lacinutrix sp. C3R15]MDO6624201.1 PD-(D/E)XK nuclease family protein [Oceanihabitans sp. 1_MG-2023]
MENIEEIIFKEPRKTFMEILKVHNQEVPFANVLAFFFRPKENHNLGTLFLDALLETKFTNIGKNSNEESTPEIPDYEITSVKVIVEQPTEFKKRIDILIVTNTFVVCIEFKINHDLNNPLTEYKNFIDNENKFNEKKKYYFILTPYKKKAIDKAEKYFENHNEFKQIILSHFIKRIDSKIEKNPNEYIVNEQYDYYKDFIQTIKNREIRSKRNIFLQNFKSDLNRKNIKSEYHKNIKGGFLEIEKEDFSLKVRFKNEGIQIEKWKNKSGTVIYEPKRNLSTDDLIKIIKTCR